MISDRGSSGDRSRRSPRVGVETPAVLTIALALALAVSQDTDPVSEREARLYRAAITLEGELAACEAREYGLTRRLLVRTPSVAASLVAVAPEPTGSGVPWPWIVATGAVGLSLGVVVGLLVH